MDFWKHDKDFEFQDISWSWAMNHESALQCFEILRKWWPQISSAASILIQPDYQYFYITSQKNFKVKQNHKQKQRVGSSDYIGDYFVNNTFAKLGW